MVVYTINDETIHIITETKRYPQIKQTRPRSNSTSSESSTVDATQESKRTRKSKKWNGRKREEELTTEEQSKFVALDCEMVGIGPNGRKSSLARVTIVTWDEKVLFDEVIRQDEEVTDYRTFVSGITASVLEEAEMDIAACKSRVLEILEDKILVGHGLKNDLRVLGISHPWYMTRDTAKYEPFMKVRFDDGVLWPRSLKELAEEKLNKKMQVDGEPHCPVVDAVAALDLYRLVRRKWEKAMTYKINKTKQIQQHKQ